MVVDYAVGGTRTRTGSPPGDFKSPALFAISTGNQAQAEIPSKTLAHSLAHESENRMQTDPDLALILDRWPMLSATAKAALVAMVKATTDTTSGKLPKGRDRR